jgi:RNA polymerase sigma factor (sigma-70 family)
MPPEFFAARERFMEIVAEFRPDLHRYCTRLVGSAIDGEDVVQETLAKAYYAMSTGDTPPLKPWLLRIAHNTAIDFLRRYDRRFVQPVADAGDQVASEGPPPDVVRAALSSFMALPVLQRSSVIMKDVLGCSVEEIADAIGTTTAAVKAYLVRGRAALRDQPRPDRIPWRDRPETVLAEHELLGQYVAFFNARNWEGVQNLLAEECRLDLVSKSARRGKKQVGNYFGAYARIDVHLAIGKAEGRHLLGVFQNDACTELLHLVSLDWEDGLIHLIRDWHYVPYLMNEISFDLGV